MRRSTRTTISVAAVVIGISASATVHAATTPKSSLTNSRAVLADRQLSNVVSIARQRRRDTWPPAIELTPRFAMAHGPAVPPSVNGPVELSPAT